VYEAGQASTVLDVVYGMTLLAAVEE